MNRALTFINFVGILALAALCAVQWDTNRRVNLLAIDLEKTRLQQTDKIHEQGKTIKGYMADLDDFRQRLTLAESQLNDARQKLASVTNERNQLQADRDKLRKALDQWIAAVAARDEAIRHAGEQIEKLAADRNDAVHRFNDLAEKYNALVKDWNQAQGKR